MRKRKGGSNKEEKEITEQLRKFKLDETYLPGELPTQIQVLSLLKFIFVSLIYY